MTAPFWSDRNVRRALGISEDHAAESLHFSGISTDSRAIREGELFVALVGERFDGHDYLADAFARGARGAVVSPGPLVVEASDQAGGRVHIYPVPDTLEALGALAAFRRNALPLRVVGITGSSGKTTTKELARAALERAFRVHATEGNFNNRIGLPLTILRTPSDTEVLILEMGTSEPGEIAALTRIATPELGIVTTVGDAHLEGLGSREGVLREKLDLPAGMPDSGSVVVGDEPTELADRARALGRPVSVAGWSERADPDLRPSEPVPDALGRYAFGWAGQRIQLGIPGRHGVSNALLALAVARFFGVSAAEAARGVERVEPIGMRGETRRIGGLTLILDCYNANPQSVEAALDLLDIVPGEGGRVAILGSMLELGEKSDDLHRRTLQSALSRPLDLVVATGEFDRTRPDRTRSDGTRPGLIGAPDLIAAYAALRERLRGNEVILLKGSRGAAVETLLPLFERDFGGEN